MKNKGFTLIELLIVIAIIGILAAMLFSGAFSAKESKNKRDALITIKNLHIAFESFKLTQGDYPSGTTLTYTGDGSGVLDQLEKHADFAFDHENLDGGDGTGVLIDPWKNAYVFETSDQNALDHTFKGVFIKSHSFDGPTGGSGNDIYQRDGE